MSNPVPPLPSRKAIDGAAWLKATASTQGACVEVAHIDAEWTGIRDTKRPGGPVQIFSANAFEAFTDAAKAGRLNRN